MTVQELINELQKIPAPTNTTVQAQYTGTLAADTAEDVATIDTTGALEITPTGLDAPDEDGGVVILTVAS